MDLEAEQFKSFSIKRKSILKDMVNDIDQMISYYEKKIDQYRAEIERFRSQRNILAEIITD